MNLYYVNHNYRYEAEKLLRLFFPLEKIIEYTEFAPTDEDYLLTRIDGEEKLVLTAGLSLNGVSKSAVKEIKKTQPNMPFIMLSALGEEYDKIHGFDLDVDDYVVKPFSPKEVMARINVIVSRREGAAKTPENKHIIIKGIDIDVSARKVYIDGKRVELTPKEYDLLTFMIKNKNIALSRNQLLSEVWGYEFFGDDRTVDTHIKMLRNSIEPYRDLISTVRGVGYIFETED